MSGPPPLASAGFSARSGFLDPRARLSSDNWLVTRILESVIRAHAPIASGRLLDVGCGHKIYAPYFEPHVDTYVGLEFPATRGGRTGDLHATALKLPFADATFDTVVSFQVLEHVADPARAIQEMFRVLGPGGAALLTTNFMWGLHEEPHDYFRFSPHALTMLFGLAGFTSVSVTPMAGYWVTAGQRLAYCLARHLRADWPLVRLPVLFGVQYCAGFLDRLDRWDADAWNYLVVAYRPPVERLAPEAVGRG